MSANTESQRHEPKRRVVLTNTRSSWELVARDRKRESDRFAQRKKREETKTRINFLESKVLFLEAGDERGIGALSDENYRLRCEIASMRGFMTEMQR